MKIILVLDPGESTGYVVDTEGCLTNWGTIPFDRKLLWEFLIMQTPDIIVLEEFVLYPSHAKGLSWNKFHTCEMIGIIKLYCDMYGTELIAQKASDKKYSGATKQDAAWLTMDKCDDTTEHTYDAYQHWCYYVRNNKGGKIYE